LPAPRIASSARLYRLMLRIIGIASAIAFVVAALAAAILARVMRRVRGDTFNSNGTRVHFTVEGEGEPVVLLHGFAVNADLNWRLPGITLSLSRKYRVIAMDLRGHGLSGKPHDIAAYGTEMVDDVVRLLDHLGIKEAHVAGYSLGAVIALKLAATHPDRLLSASLLGAGWEQPDNSVFLDAIPEIEADLRAGQGVGPLVGYLGDDREKPGLIHTTWVKLASRYINDGEALAAVVGSIPALALQEHELRQIRVPMCGIAGSRDSLRVGVESLRGLVPDSKVVIIDGADHVSAPRRPELCKALMAFLGERREYLNSEAEQYRHPESLATTEWLAAHLEDPSVRVVDMRYYVRVSSDGSFRPESGVKTYMEGHIPGAVFVDFASDIADPDDDIPLNILSLDRFEALMGRLGINDETTVVVYDDSGGTWAARLWWALRYYGHDDVKVLNGGITKWSAEGRPLESNIPVPAATTFRAQVRPELRATRDDVMRAIESEDVVVDALPEVFYTGRARLYPTHRAGHIPTARNVPAPANLDPATQTLLPAAQLARLWRTAIMNPEQKAITYCGAGAYGAFDLFVMHLLGYENVSLYDSSWMEWGADEDLPVATGP
jgi:thiosulfate/3-mercaptopyruvate sulfurtransferase